MQELRENKTCCAMYATIIAAVVASAMGAGCQQLRDTWGLSFANGPPAYKQAYGPTPRQRMDALQQLARRSATLTPEELFTAGAELTAALNTENDPQIRGKIVQTLGALPGNLANEALLDAMDDPVAAVRCAACEAWAAKPDANQALAALHERITADDDPDVRLTAVRAIASCDSPHALQYLASALEHRDPAMRMTAIEALEEISGERFGSDVHAWRQFVARQQAAPAAPPSSIASPAAVTTPQMATQSTPSAVQPASNLVPASAISDDGDFVR